MAKMKNRKTVDIRPDMSYDMEQMIADTFYGKIDPRRRQEIHDAYMVREDEKAMANLPRQAIHHEYNMDKFKYDGLAEGSPNWNNNAVGFIRRNQKGFVRDMEF
jgi:hypothetical protein